MIGGSPSSSVEKIEETMDRERRKMKSSWMDVEMGPKEREIIEGF